MIRGSTAFSRVFVNSECHTYLDGLFRPRVRTLLLIISFIRSEADSGSSYITALNFTSEHASVCLIVLLFLAITGVYD